MDSSRGNCWQCLMSTTLVWVWCFQLWNDLYWTWNVLFQLVYYRSTTKQPSHQATHLEQAQNLNELIKQWKKCLHLAAESSLPGNHRNHPLPIDFSSIKSSECYNRLITLWKRSRDWRACQSHKLGQTFNKSRAGRLLIASFLRRRRVLRMKAAWRDPRVCRRQPTFLHPSTELKGEWGE